MECLGILGISSQRIVVAIVVAAAVLAIVAALVLAIAVAAALATVVAIDPATLPAIVLAMKVELELGLGLGLEVQILLYDPFQPLQLSQCLECTPGNGLNIHSHHSQMQSIYQLQLQL